MNSWREFFGEGGLAVLIWVAAPETGALHRETQQGCSVTRTLEACATQGTQPGRTARRQASPDQNVGVAGLRYDGRGGAVVGGKLFYGWKFLRERGLGFLIFEV